MKKVFIVVIAVSAFAACKRKTEADTRNMVLVDTTQWTKKNAYTDAPKEKPAPARVERTETYSAVKTTNNATIPREKGWSEAAKGAAVGGGSGAIIGAVVNKDNRAGGAVIGSVIGAGTGYVIGRSRDKKSGRVARQKARKKANQ